MSFTLTHNAYGKSRVLLTKVTRVADQHDLKEVSVNIQLEGDFADAYTHGDNANVIPTDTMKNTVYALSKNHHLSDLESFGHTLVRHFMGSSHVRKVMIHLEQQNWQRIVVQGNQLPHAFVGGTSEKRICTVTGDRERIRIVPGVEGLILLKTTDSAFRGFLRDSFTTLMETDERILATKLDACWEYGATTVDWNRCFDVIWRTLVEVFANHKSLGVQHTLHAMGAAALEACAELQEISLTMLNQHRLPVDLRPFGLENPNEIFVPTEEPFGKISGTLRRS